MVSTSLPRVGCLRTVLYLATKGGQDQDEPIQNTLRALAYAADPDAFRRLAPTEPSPIRGICYMFQDEKLFQDCEAALFFLPLIGDR